MNFGKNYENENKIEAAGMKCEEVITNIGKNLQGHKIDERV